MWLIGWLLGGFCILLYICEGVLSGFSMLWVVASALLGCSDRFLKCCYIDTMFLGGCKGVLSDY